MMKDLLPRFDLPDWLLAAVLFAAAILVWIPTLLRLGALLG